MSKSKAAEDPILSQSAAPPPSGSSGDGARQLVRGKTNRLFLSFALLSFAVALINIQFHHRFHDEHVHDASRKRFQEHFRTSRHEVPTVDDYILRRGSVVEDGEGEGGVGDGGATTQQRAGPGGGGQHKLAGLKCAEKYGGPEDEYAEKEMAFWSDIPSDASYKSPFMDETERFLTFEP